MKQGDLTFERASQLLAYEPETGRFTWLVSRRGRGARVGSPAGTIDHRGYRVICIDGKKHNASRLAFLLMTGSHPSVLMDHKNRDKGDDRWENLREANYSQNGANVLQAPSSGLKGAYFDRRRGVWFSSIRVRRQQRRLGDFPSAEAAHQAYCAAATEAFGQFARFE